MTGDRVIQEPPLQIAPVAASGWASSSKTRNVVSQEPSAVPRGSMLASASAASSAPGVSKAPSPSPKPPGISAGCHCVGPGCHPSGVPSVGK
jgi:hypothetical protein